MADLEKVLKGLECCCSMTGEACRQCPYDEECAEKIGSGYAHLCSDALALLKEQPETRITVDANGIRTDRVAHWKGFMVLRFYGLDDDGEPIYRRGLFYACSKCKRRTVIKTPYCPQCGAKMDEEVKQDERS